jgi:N-acetylneuraminate synthase
MGKIELAVEMIKIASQFCKADAVKFQKRSVKELLTEEEYNAPHPNPHNAFGLSYGQHREYLEFDLRQHAILKQECEKWKIAYSSSVWDLTSAREISSLNPEFIKIPSASNTNYEMLGYLCDNYRGDIHVALGMTTKAEEKEIVNFFVDRKRVNSLVVYSCTSGYPVPDRDVCLSEIGRLRDAYGKMVKAVGFSGHHNGIAIDIAAFVMGATCIERHFTLDRTQKGTDHAASLEPDGLRRVVRDLNSVNTALSYKGQEILEIEKEQRRKLKWNRHQGKEGI